MSVMVKISTIENYGLKYVFDKWVDSEKELKKISENSDFEFEVIYDPYRRVFNTIYWFMHGEKLC